jgi:hypothetical protein
MILIIYVFHEERWPFAAGLHLDHGRLKLSDDKPPILALLVLWHVNISFIQGSFALLDELRGLHLGLTDRVERVTTSPGRVNTLTRVACPLIKHQQTGSKRLIWGLSKALCGLL